MESDMGECFSSAGRMLAQGVSGAIDGIGKALRRDGGDKADRSEDGLTNESKKLPKQRNVNKDVKVDRASHPEIEMSDVDPEDLIKYEEFLGEIAEDEDEGLKKCLKELGRSEPGCGAVKQALAKAANLHVQCTIDLLPQAFGLENEEIRNWLLQTKPGTTVAADLKNFITDRMAEQGHGPAAANWLYQQILAAGSTCMTSQALESDNIDRCKDYLQRTISEIGQLRQHCDSKESAKQLIAQWAVNDNTKWDDKFFKALVANVKGGDFTQSASVEESSSGNKKRRKDGATIEFIDRKGFPGSGFESAPTRKPGNDVEKNELGCSDSECDDSSEANPQKHVQPTGTAQMAEKFNYGISNGSIDFAEEKRTEFQNTANSSRSGEESVSNAQ